jgi:hypothetical protein
MAEILMLWNGPKNTTKGDVTTNRRILITKKRTIASKTGTLLLGALLDLVLLTAIVLGLSSISNSPFGILNKEGIRITVLLASNNTLL